MYNIDSQVKMIKIPQSVQRIWPKQDLTQDRRHLASRRQMILKLVCSEPFFVFDWCKRVQIRQAAQKIRIKLISTSI